MERRRVGAIEVIALIDMVQSYPATAVYPNAGDALGRFGGYLDSAGAVALNFAGFLLIDGDERVLVDTGWGPEHQGQLPAELRAAGVRQDEITQVTFTHLHGDHTGWNIDRGSGKPLFPNARYLIPQKDWDHYSEQTPVPSSFTRDVAALPTGQVTLIEGETVLTPSMTTIETPGHTPGHTSVIVSSNGERGFILGDVVLTHIDAELPALDCSFDWDHQIARVTREAIMARLAADRSLVGASHLPAPGFGRFELSGAGATRWSPA